MTARKNKKPPKRSPSVDPQAAARERLSRALDLARRCNQSETADRIGVDQSTVNAFCAGRRLPSRKLAIALAKLWRLGTDDIFNAGEALRKKRLEENDKEKEGEKCPKPAK